MNINIYKICIFVHVLKNLYEYLKQVTLPEWWDEVFFVDSW